MQLIAELPAILVMFLCGASGYFFVDFMKRKATANLKNQTKSKKLENDLEPTDEPASDGTKAAEHPAEGALLLLAPANCEVADEQLHVPLNPRAERLLAKKAARKTRKAQEAAAAAKEETEVGAAKTSVPCEAPVVVTTASDADAEEASLHCNADASIVTCESTMELNSAVEGPFPSTGHREESDSGSISTDEATRLNSGFRLRRRTSRWADDESGEEWELNDEERQQLFADLDEEERRRLFGEFPETTDDEGSDWNGAWSEDELEEASAAAQTAAVDQSVAMEPRPKADESVLTSCGQSRRRSRQKRARKRRRNNAKKQQANDNWMTPFSELLKGDASLTPFAQLRRAPVGAAGTASPQAPLGLQRVGQPLQSAMQPMAPLMQPLQPPRGAQPVVLPMAGQPMGAPPAQPVLPTVNPIGPAVCIWNTTNSSAAKSRADGNPQDIFTDGSQVFQSVPSTSGQPLFTDGNQLYASVCVMLGALPSNEAGRAPFPEASPEPSSTMDNCGTIEEHSVANLISFMDTSDEEDWD
jgi:hypothetical protein